MNVLKRCIKAVAFLPPLFFLACVPPVQNSRDFKNWFNDLDNDFLKHGVIAGIAYSVQFRPIDLVMINEINFDRTYSPAELDAIRRGYGNSVYFLLTVSVNQNKSKEGNKPVMDRIKFDESLSFNVGQKIRMISKGKSILPSLYHYEKAYELSDSFVFLVAFPYEGECNVAFRFDDDIFNNEAVSFDFDLCRKYPPLPIKTSPL